MKISFFTLLGLLFIGLKLANVITWSWIWVLAPVWGQLLFLVLFLSIILAFRTTRDAFIEGATKRVRTWPK